MVPTPLESALATRGALVLDGAMATELERSGANLSGGLWSARLLLDQPELIADVHRDYLEAGADVLITASYQASVAGFVRSGLDRSVAERLIASSVELAARVRDDFWSGATRADPGLPGRRTRPLVATSVGPYGAVLADGSEYRGDYAINHGQLVAFHRERLKVLVSAGVEVLACETIPSLVEAQALVEALADWPQLTAWVSFSARNDRQISDGTAIADCGRFLDAQPQVVAVGVNCTAVPHITPLIDQLGQTTSLPIVVYPNSGEVYDAEQQSWTGAAVQTDFGQLTREWYAAGARLIGGCCRTGPAEIRAVSGALREAATGADDQPSAPSGAGDRG